MTNTRRIVTAASVLVLAVTGSWGAEIKTSTYGGDLTLAVEAAAEGDTIIVDVPSSSAFIFKRLHLKGTSSGSTGPLFLFNASSGSSFRYLRITGGVGIQCFFGIDIDDITVAHCEIDTINAGICSGEFADNWHIHHNDINVQNYWGIAVYGGSKDFSIHHNSINTTTISIALFNGNPFHGNPNAATVSDIKIFNNECDARRGVWLRSSVNGGLKSNVEIRGNDLTETEIPVQVDAFEIHEDPRTEVGSYVWNLAPGTVEGLLIRNNET